MIIKHIQIILAGIICSFLEMNFNPEFINMFPEAIFRQKMLWILSLAFIIMIYSEIFGYYLIIKIAEAKKVKFKDYFKRIASIRVVLTLFGYFIALVVVQYTNNKLLFKITECIASLVITYFTHDYLLQINVKKRKRIIIISLFIIINISMIILPYIFKTVI